MASADEWQVMQQAIVETLAKERAAVKTAIESGGRDHAAVGAAHDAIQRYTAAVANGMRVEYNRRRFRPEGAPVSNEEAGFHVTAGDVDDMLFELNHQTEWSRASFQQWARELSAKSGGELDLLGYFGITDEAIQRTDPTSKTAAAAEERRRLRDEIASEAEAKGRYNPWLMTESAPDRLSREVWEFLRAPDRCVARQVMEVHSDDLLSDPGYYCTYFLCWLVTPLVLGQSIQAWTRGRRLSRLLGAGSVLSVVGRLVSVRRSLNGRRMTVAHGRFYQAWLSFFLPFSASLLQCSPHDTA